MTQQAFYAGSTGDSVASVANAAAVITLPAQQYARRALRVVRLSYSGTPAAPGVLTIEDGAGSIIHRRHIFTAGPHTFEFDPPLAGTPGRAMVITLSAGGTGVTGFLNVQHQLH